MKKPILSLIVSVIFTLNILPINTAYSGTLAAEYLCEMGVAYYKVGKLNDALTEFNKALMIDPHNKTAKKYINTIFSKNTALKQKETQESYAPIEREQLQITDPTREDAINNALAGSAEFIAEQKDTEKDAGLSFGGLKVTGETQVSLGSTPDDSLIWKRANADLNEKNWRILSNDAFNRRTNTYDPRVYDRLRVNLDTENKEGFNFHTNITVDPWSFTGKSDKATITSVFGDVADVQLKYWSNTGYTINETVYSDRFGNSFNIPEIKVVDGKTSAMGLAGAFTPNDSFPIPATEINRLFQPLREFWFDYNQEGTKVRVFPIGYQDQAYTSDDPLRLSNNHIWWQESPWIDSWVPGHLNFGATPQDFTRGKLDDALSYFTRDSDGTRLTALRGFALQLDTIENLALNSTFATPKGLWQDYDSVDNIINATRAKYFLMDNLSLGALFTYRLGLDENKARDMANYVGGFDIGYEIFDGLKLDFEVAGSKTQSDLTHPDYKSQEQGNAYNFSVTGSFPGKNITGLKYGYYEIKPEETDTSFARYKFYATRMDDDFDPTLSNYRETRDDTFWSRHIHFRQPMKYYFAGLYQSALGWDDLEPYKIGNGIDTGRSVLGFRLETKLFDNKIDNLFDVRNVHNTNNKFIENVARDELTVKVTDKLTSKILGIYQKLPKTKGGTDPFIFDNETGDYLLNAAIEDGKDPSLKTGSLGLEYSFTDWISLSGIWERTNDSTLAYDNYPRGDLNSSSMTTVTSSENDKIFREQLPFLYSQGLFPLPPYPFYNIWKTGLRINPLENMEIYLDYTRNEFKSAGQIDDNMNHIGCELSYQFSKKMGVFLRYTYSRWNDINRMLSGEDKIYLGHHNYFTEFRFYPSEDDELSLGYGESGISPVATVTFDPFGGSVATLDTRHIVRVYYRKKF